MVLVLSNTRRYESRYRLFKKTLVEMERTPGVRLTVVEMAFSYRPHVVGDPANPRHLLLRNPDELWHKEQMINLGAARLPEDWKYIAWIDGDVEFVNRETWAHETVDALQHYKIVQPWSCAVDLGPDGEALQQFGSFGDLNARGLAIHVHRSGYYSTKSFPHPGYAWAARRDAFNEVGGLVDTAILGAADHHMAWAILGKGLDTCPSGITQGYRKPILDWQDRALRYIKGNVGVVPGTILHHWHGKKRDRQYGSRWKILVRNKFDPATDLVRDWQGLWRLRVESPRQIRLRDEVRRYMSSRNEDSVDIE